MNSIIPTEFNLSLQLIFEPEFGHLVATKMINGVITHNDFYIPICDLERLNNLDSFQSQKAFLIDILKSGDYSNQDNRCLITYDQYEHTTKIEHILYNVPNSTGIFVQLKEIMIKPYTFYIN